MRFYFQNMVKKASMYFSALVYVFFVVFLVFLLIVVKMKDKNIQNLVIGQEALSLFNSYQEGEKIRFYVQQSAKYSSESSVEVFLKNGGFENPPRLIGLADWTNAKPDFKKEFSIIFSNQLKEYFQRSEDYIPSNYDIEIFNDKDFVIISGIALENAVLVSGKSNPQNLVWPTGTFNRKYSVASSFGPRTHPITKKTHFHEGIDIDSDSKEIYAVENGVVELVNTGCNNCYYNSENDKSDENCFKCGQSYGNYVLIDHGNFKSLYAHLEEVRVNIGKSINKGEVIGIMGSTGSSTSPHLHFEIRVNNKQVNPICYYEGLEIDIRDKKKTGCGNTKYNLNLSFKTAAKINFNNYETLYKNIQSIIADCKISTNREDCFNSRLSSIGYSEDCYEDFEKPFYEILKTINYCNSSLEDNCYCPVDLTTISSTKLNNYDYEIFFIKNSSTGKMFVAANLGDKGLKEYFDLIKIISFDKTGIIEEENNFKIKLSYSNDILKNTEFQVSQGRPINTNSEIIFFKKDGLLYFANPRDYYNLKNNFKECSLRKNIFPVCIDGIRFAIRTD